MEDGVLSNGGGVRAGSLRPLLILEVGSEQREVSFAESLFGRLCLMPIGVKQYRLADRIQPGAFLYG
jgi:hypothetical protein